MKMDRNLPDNNGHGKYALLKLRKLADFRGNEAFSFNEEIKKAISVLERNGIIDWGEVGSESEFFVIRLKDKHSEAALLAYAEDALEDDPEWANEVVDMAKRAGRNNPRCKLPD